MSAELLKLKCPEPLIVAYQKAIAELTQTQKDLQESRRELDKLRQVVDRTTPAAWVDENGILQSVNEGFTRILGHTPDELLNRPHPLLNSNCYPAEFWEQEVWSKVKRDRIWRGELQNCTPDGREIWYETTIVPWSDGDGNPEQYWVVSHEITPRKRAERELIQLSWVASQTDNGVVITDRRGRIEWVNEGFVRISGYTPEQAIGQTPGSFLQGPLTDLETVRQIRDALRAARPYRGEILNYNRHGEPYWLSLSITPIFDGDGEPTQFIAIQSDITERKRLEEALRESSARNRSLIEAVPDLMFCLDQDGVFLDYFPAKAGENLPTSKTVLGRPVEEVFPPDLAGWTRHYLNLTLATGELQSGEYVLPGGEGWRGYEARYVPGGEGAVLAIVRDITDRKAMEAALLVEQQLEKRRAAELEKTLDKLRRTQMQLIQAEKLSSLGQMIAGIAHEINNPLAFIHGNLMHVDTYVGDIQRLLNLYRQYYPEPVREIGDLLTEIDVEFLIDDLPKALESMKLGTVRIREIVSSLRNFSRLDQAKMKAVDLHEGIESTLLILHSRLKSKAGEPETNIIRNYGNLPPVECHASQINQVFMNLISNAIEALEQQPAPRNITIATGVEAGATVVTIADNGPGIPEAIRQQIFDPFFTTKPIGKGTGLGLAIAHQIVVEKHGGRLECQSRPGGGTRFIITLPAGSSPAGR